MDDLNILIKAKLSSTKEEIESQITTLNNKITKAISVKLKIDAKDLTMINDTMDKIKKATSQVGNQRIKIFNEADLKDQGIKYKRGVMSTIEEVERYLKGAFNGKKFDLGNIIKDSSGNIKSFEASIKSANNQLEKVKFNLAEIARTNANGALKTASGYILGSSQISRIAVKPEQIFDRTKLESEGRQFFLSSQNIVERVKREFSSLGSVDVNFLKNAQQNITGFIASVTRADGVVEKLKFDMARIASGNSIQRGYIFSGENLIDNNAGSNIQKTLDKLQLYENKIAKLKAGFSSPSSGGIRDAENLASLNAEYDRILSTINQVRDSNTNLSNEQRRGIIQNISSLELEITRYRDLQRVMSSTSGTSSANGSNNTALFQVEMQNRINGLQVGRQTVFERPEIQTALNNLTTNLSRFGTEGGRSTRELNLEFAQLTTSVRTATNEITRLNGAADNIVTTFTKDIMKLGLWSLAATAMYAPLRGMQTAVTYVNDLDNALNQIRIVTGQTQPEVEKLAKSYNELGKQMSVSTKDIADTSVDLYRQGLQGNDVEERMQAIIKYAKISSISMADSNKIITATMNATGESAQKVIDTFSYLGDATASGADEIGVAMQKVASMNDGIGVSMQKAASWVAVISSKTREGASQIGTSLKSLESRYSSIKSRGFNDEDATNINEVTKALTKAGIQATTSDGQLRNFGEVIDELGAKYSGLDAKTQNYLMTTLGGTYQMNRLRALMDGYSQSVDLYNNSLNQAGIANQKFNTWQESTGAKLEKLSSTFQGFYGSIADSHVIKGLIDSLTFLISRFGNLTTVLSLVGTALAIFKGTSVITFLESFSLNTSLLSSRLVQTQASLAGLSFAEIGAMGTTQALGFAIKGLWASIVANPIGMVVTAMTLAVVAFDLFGNKAEEISQKQKEAIDAYKSQQIEITSLMQTYKQNAELAKTDDNAKIQLIQTEERLRDIFGESANSLDLQNGKIDENIKKIKELSDEKQKDFIRENSLKAQEGQKTLNKRNLIPTSELSQVVSEYADKSLLKAGGMYNVQEEIDAIRSAMDKIVSTGKGKEFLQELTDELERLKTLKEDADKLQLMVNASNKEIVQNSVDNVDKLSDAQKKVYDTVKDSLTFTNQNQYKNNLEEVIDTISKWDGKNLDDLNGKLHKIDASLPPIVKDAKDVKDGIDNVSSSLKSLADSTKTNSDNIKTYNQLLSDVSDGQSLSADKALDMIVANEDLAKAITITSDSVTINKDALEKLRIAEIDTTNVTIQAEINKKDAVINGVKTRIEAYKNELESLKVVANAYSNNDEINQAISEHFQAKGATQRVVGNLQSQLDELEAGKKKLEELKNAYSNPNYGVSSSKDSSKSSSSKDQILSIQSTTSALLAQIQAESSLQKAISDRIQKELDQAKLDKDYTLILQKENELMASQAKELENLTNARDKVNQLKDSALSSSKFGDTSRWFTGDSNEESVAFVNEKNSASEEVRKSMDEEFKSMQILRNGWVSLTKSIEENGVAQKTLSKQIKDDTIKGIQDQIKSIQDADTSSIQQSFDNLTIDDWIKNNVSATKDFKTTLKELEDQIARIGSPKTLEGQLKLNALMKQSAEATYSAKKATDEYAKTLENARLQAIMDQADASLQAIQTQIDNVDQQLKLVQGGSSSQVPTIDYNIVPTIRLDTADEAVQKAIAQHEADNYEYKPPTSFVEFMNNDFTNTLTTVTSNIDTLNQKIKSLGEVSPENKDQLLSYYDSIKQEIDKLTTASTSAQDSLKLKLSIGEISQSDFDQKMSQIKLADLSILAIPRIEITSDTLTEIETFKAKLSAIPVDLDTKIFDNVMTQKLEEDYRTTITANLEHTAFDQSIIELTAPSVKVITIQTVSTPIPANAKGSSGTPAGLAQIDDGTGNEIIIEPNKKPYIHKENGSKIVDLPKGTKIIPAEESKEILKKNNIPAYAGGVGDSGYIAGRTDGVWVQGGGYAGGKLIPPHWQYPGVQYYIPGTESTQPSTSTNNSTQPSTSTTSSTTASPISSNPQTELELINQKIALYQLLTTTATQSIATLTSQMAQYKIINPDGSTSYQDNETTRKLVPQINAAFQAEKSAQLAIKQLIIDKFNAEYEGFDKAQAQTDTGISYYEKTLSYQKLIGASSEKQIETEKWIQGIQGVKLDSLTKEKAQLEGARDLLKEGSQEWELVNDKVNTVNSSILDMNTSIEQTAQDVAKIKLDAILNSHSESQSASDTAISYYQKVLDYQKLTVVNSEEQIETEKTILALQKYKLVGLQAEKKQLQDNLATQIVGSDKWKETNAEIDKVTTGIQDAETAIAQTYGTVADKVIDAYKSAYKEQEDIALASIDKQEKAYNDLIATKIKALDETSTTTDYNEGLTKAQEDAQKTQDKLNALSLDNSIEGKAKRLELEQQLADQKLAIATTMRHRDTELQKQSLQDQQTNNTAIVAEQKKTTTNYYEGLINDDAKYAEIRKKIYEGNFADIEKDFDGFNTYFKSQNQSVIDDLGISWQGLLTLIDKVKTAGTEVKSLPVDQFILPPVNNIKPVEPPIINNDQNSPHLDAKTNRVVNLTPEMQQWIYTIRSSQHRSPSDIEIASHFNLKKFDTGGQTTKTGLHWLDGTPSKPEGILSPEQNQSWIKLVKDLPSITNIMDKLLKVNPLENILNNIKIPDYSGIKFQPATTGGNGNSGDIHLNFNIANLNGGSEGAKEMFSIIANNMKKFGKW